MSKEASVREKLIAAATTLFAGAGYHAVGVAEIIRTANVSRAALYAHFRSKEELILAVLRRRDEVSRNAIMREVERAAPDPAGRLLALFDFLSVWFRDTDFAGCMFLNAAAEYHDPDDPIHRATIEHKRLVLDYIRRLCEELGPADPKALAHQIYLLVDGAIVQTHASGNDALRLAAAKSAARTLIAAAAADVSAARAG